MTEKGTLILSPSGASPSTPPPQTTAREDAWRFAPAVAAAVWGPARPAARAFTETRRMEAASIAPFAIDIFDEEDHFPPARNSDALGLRLPTLELDLGRSTTRGSFLAGLSAGLTALAIAGALAFVSFTSDYASHVAGRSPNLVAHGQSTLTVAEPDMAVLKAPPAKRHLKRAHLSAETAPAEIPVEMLPDASESE